MTHLLRRGHRRRRARMRGWLRVAQEWRLLATAVDLTASLPWHRLQTGRLERGHGCLNHRQGRRSRTCLHLKLDLAPVTGPHLVTASPTLRDPSAPRF
jgi:hypothetical protein